MNKRQVKKMRKKFGCKSYVKARSKARALALTSDLKQPLLSAKHLVGCRNLPNIEVVLDLYNKVRSGEMTMDDALKESSLHEDKLNHDYMDNKYTFGF